MEPLSLELTLEQSFEIRKFEDGVKDLSREDLEDLFIQVFRQSMIYQNISSQLLKENMGL